MRVLLIKPFMRYTEKTALYKVVPIPMGLAYIASFLEKQGLEVSLLDAFAEQYNRFEKEGEVFVYGLSKDEIKNQIKKIKPNAIGIGNLFTEQAKSMFMVAEAVKEVDSSIPVFVGGVQPSSSPKECLSNPNIDFVIMGEGEETTYELLNCISERGDVSQVNGIGFKKDGKIFFTKSRKLHPNLDDFPFPAYHLLPMERYMEANLTDTSIRSGYHQRTASIVTSRGCPFRCIFCATKNITGHSWRGRSPEDVIKEIEFLYERWSVRFFNIDDLNFALDPERVSRLCDLIIERNLDMQFGLPNGIRAESVSTELIKKMKLSGFRDITIAAEHGDQKFLNEVIKKDISLKKVEEAVEIITKEGLPVSCFFILGFPYETEETLNKTYKEALKLARLGAVPQIQFAIPLPNTEMHEICLKEGLLPEKLDADAYLSMMYFEPIIIPDGLSKEYLIRLKRKIILLSCIILLLFHPRIFFRIPFISESITDLRNPGMIKERLQKILHHVLNI